MTFKILSIVFILIFLGGCSITHQLVYPDDSIQTDPVYVIVTGNIPLIMPSGNYTISGNEIILK